MESCSEELASYVSLAPKGLEILAAILDQSIQESVDLRRERGGRKNGAVLHGLVREGVILAANDSKQLAEEGITIRSGSSDSIVVQIKGAKTSLRLVHRPRAARQADHFLANSFLEEEALFPVPVGHIRLFYSVSNGSLGRLTVSRTLSDPKDYFIDCQVLEEVTVPYLASSMKTVTDENTRNDADDLSGLIRSKNDQTAMSEESNTDAETGEATASAG